MKTINSSQTKLSCRKIFAVDKDAHRLTTMNTLTLKAGVVCVQLIHSDFLRINPDDPAYAEVEYAIVDPSCSGSGMFISPQMAPLALNVIEYTMKV